jgi:hypothetical protein
MPLTIIRRTYEPEPIHLQTENEEQGHQVPYYPIQVHTKEFLLLGFKEKLEKLICN